MRTLFFFAIIAAAFILGAQAERSYGVSVFWAPQEIEVIDEAATDQAPAAQDPMMQEEKGGSSGQESPDVRVAIPVERLTESQKTMLRSLGVDPDSITVTQETITCAEGALGAARLSEIQGGATPTFAEGLKLLGCYSR